MELHPRETVVLAEDFKAMVDWYRDVLGFEIDGLFEEDYRYCNLRNENGIRLGIGDAKEAGVEPEDRRNNTVVLQFQVRDVRGFLEYVSGKGGTVTLGPAFDEKGGFWYGRFTDREGNPFWVVDENCP